MENKLIDSFKKKGTVQTLDAFNAFSLQGAPDVWLVQEGTVNLFFAQYSQTKELVNALVPIWEINSNELIFSFANTNNDNQIIAKPNVGAKVLRLSLTDFTNLLLQKENLPDGSMLLEQWINHLSELINSSLIPRNNLILLDANEPALTVSDGKVVSAKKEFVWLKSSTAPLRLNGKSELTFEQGIWLPISTKTWAYVVGDTELSLLKTADFMAQDGAALLSSLTTFNNTLFASVITLHLELANNAKNNLTVRLANDRGFLIRALRNLMEITQKKRVVRGDTIQFAHDPLFAAIDVIGKNMRINFNFPRDTDLTAPLENRLESLGYYSKIQQRKVALEGDWWQHEHGTMLGFMKANQKPVAIVQIKPNHYVLHDPETSSDTLITPQVAQTLTSDAYVFYRSFADKKINLISFIKLGALGTLPDLVTIGIIGVLGALLGLIPPIVTGKLFSDVLPNAESGQLAQLSLALFAGAFGVGIFQLTRYFALTRISEKSSNTLNAALLARLFRAPVRFFRQYLTGDLVNRVFGFTVIQQIIAKGLIDAFLEGIFALFYIILLFKYSVKLALFACGTVFAITLISLIVNIFQLIWAKDFEALTGKLSGMLNQYISGIAKIRIAGAENRFFYMWATLFAQMRNKRVINAIVGNSLVIFNILGSTIVIIIVFKQAAVPILTKELSTGDFLAFYSALGTFSAVTMKLLSTVVASLRIVPLYERLKPILLIEPETNEFKADPGQLAGEIKARNLFFSYDVNSQMIINDVSFDVDVGSFVAIVGSSGSGKSTLLRLLLQFEVPNKGMIYFDGKDLANIDIDLVRRQIGVVLQKDQLYPGDIFHNIVGVSSSYTIDDAWEAARMANIDNDIKAMPMGMFTIVGENGSGLSGGQCQKLMIARAIVHKPRILFFDEATSALDNAAQNVVAESLKNLKATRIVVAHRLSTIIDADKIIVLDAGKIVETGTYEELIKNNGLFAALAKRQIA